MVFIVGECVAANVEIIPREMQPLERSILKFKIFFIYKCNNCSNLWENIERINWSNEFIIIAWYNLL